MLHISTSSDAGGVVARDIETIRRELAAAMDETTRLGKAVMAATDPATHRQLLAEWEASYATEKKLGREIVNAKG